MLGWFDTTAVPAGWFDQHAQDGGWFDESLLEAAAVGGSISAALNVTDEADALSSAGSVLVSASLSVTDEADALAAAGTVLSGISGALNLTDDDDALTSAASVSVAATFSQTDAADVLTAAGSVLAVAAATLTDEDDELQADGAVSSGADVVATFTQTDAADTLQASGTVPDAPPQVISLGGSIDYQLLEKRRAKFWRMDDDDQVVASATVSRAKVKPLPVVAGSLALNDADDALTSRTIVVVPLRLIRTTPKATLRRAA